MKIIIASHGDFSRGCVNTLKMIMGNEFVKNISVYSLQIGENPNDYVKNLNFDNDEYVVFTDIYGGSVFNAFASCIENHNIRLVSGTNINVLIEFMISQEENLDKRIEQAVKNAKDSLQVLKSLENIQENEEF